MLILSSIFKFFIAATPGIATLIWKIFDSKKTYRTKIHELLMLSLKENSISNRYIIECQARELCGDHITYDIFVNMLNNKNSWMLINKFKASIHYINFDNDCCNIKLKYVNRSILLESLLQSLYKSISLVICMAAVFIFIFDIYYILTMSVNNDVYLEYFGAVIVSAICGIVVGFCSIFIVTKRSLKDGHEFVALYNNGLKSNQKYYY